MQPPRQLLFDRLLAILHRCLVQARCLAQTGDRRQLYDLADTFEVVPEAMARWNEDSLARIREILTAYQEKYPGTAFDYLAMLDMTDAEFAALHETVPDSAWLQEQTVLK